MCSEGRKSAAPQRGAERRDCWPLADEDRHGITQHFEAFAASHRIIYATPICYSVEYDEQAWVEAADKVAGRVWITTSRPGESPTRIKVVLIAAFTDGRISRLWEATWPSWNALPTFETYGSST